MKFKCAKREGKTKDEERKNKNFTKKTRVIFSEIMKILHNQEFTVMKTRMMNNFDSIKILMRIETEKQYC